MITPNTGGSRYKRIATMYGKNARMITARMMPLAISNIGQLFKAVFIRIDYKLWMANQCRLAHSDGMLTEIYIEALLIDEKVDNSIAPLGLPHA